MSGRIISMPAREHSCAPGWEWRQADSDSDMVQVFGASSYGIPPKAHEYPAGTRWRCDGCAAVWVSTGHPPNLLMPQFRRERWLERRRRQRAAGYIAPKES